MKKKLLLGLMCSVLVLGLSTGCGNETTGGKDNNGSKDTAYYDESRTINSTYTFDEATNKFAFKVNETTLVFEGNDKVSLEMLTNEKTMQDELMNPQFEHKQDVYTSLGTMYLGETNATTLEEFKNNFQNGILSDKTKWKVEDVKIIESTSDYVFASWVNKAFTTNHEYYFAKKIGNKIYYAYHSTLVSYNDKKISLLLEEFKNLFTCLSQDDGKEPYIYDKVMNVPMALGMKIKNANNISAIIKSDNDYLDGSISFSSENGDYINVEYGADGHYDKIDWTDTFNSNMKYTNEDDEILVGIKDNNTQVFEITIYSDKKITNEKEFNSYISDYLIIK